MAQDSNNQPATAPASGDVFIPIIPNNVPLPPPVSRSEARRSEQYVRATLNLLDRNNDGYLSAAEAQGLQNVLPAALRHIIGGLDRLQAYNQSVSNLPTLVHRSIVIDNPVLFDAGSITERYANNPSVPGLLPADVARIVRDVLPKGVATIRVSDVAAEVPGMSTVVLPHNKISIGAPGPRS